MGGRRVLPIVSANGAPTVTYVKNSVATTKKGSTSVPSATDWANSDKKFPAGSAATSAGTFSRMLTEPGVDGKEQVEHMFTWNETIQAFSPTHPVQVELTGL